ncbi:unnamed protein product [Trichobilharzia szidati]|nr:unnamed protein product [Trichobilharzia szidati]
MSSKQIIKCKNTNLFCNNLINNLNTKQYRFAENFIFILNKHEKYDKTRSIVYALCCENSENNNANFTNTTDYVLVSNKKLMTSFYTVNKYSC